MTLDNLLSSSLDKITPDAVLINHLIAAAYRNICDAELTVLSNENRFDVAYKAILQIANASLQACGYRTKTSVPGHHATLLQSLPKTLQVESVTVVILDKLRKKRNVIDYSGDLVESAMVDECIQQARHLFRLYQQKFKQIDK